VAVFDSGLGSLSIARAIRRRRRVELFYFADVASFPYGSKSKDELGRIVSATVDRLQDMFAPDVIVVASNTPSLVLEMADGPGLVTVRPPVSQACSVSVSKRVGILGTRGAVRSDGLSRHIQRETDGKTRIFKIDGSELVQLVESGAFLNDRPRCRDVIRRTLAPAVVDSGIDTVTLSSTHLPFLLPMLRAEYPDVNFLDPARQVAEKVVGAGSSRRGEDIGIRRRSTLRIFASGDYAVLQQNLLRLGVRRVVRPLAVND